MKMTNSSYWTYWEDCYDTVTWTSHCTSRNGVHWYNQDHEAMVTAGLCKLTWAPSLSTAITPQCGMAGSCAYAVHSSYFSSWGLWFDYSHDFPNFPSLQSRPQNVTIHQFSVERHPSTVWSVKWPPSCPWLMRHRVYLHCFPSLYNDSQKITN